MGYAKIEQVASGIHLRLRTRAFIVAASKGNRVVFVNLDACMGSQIVTTKVIERLKARYGEMYTEKNVAISGTHTHAGPGGYLQYLLYIITSYGFVRQSFDVIVDGIEKSIIQAHENLRPGSVFVDEGELLGAGVNRSPSAHLNNPVSERSKHKYDVDKEMTLLKFVDDDWDSPAYNSIHHLSSYSSLYHRVHQSWYNGPTWPTTSFNQTQICPAACGENQCKVQHEPRQCFLQHHQQPCPAAYNNIPSYNAVQYNNLQFQTCTSKQV